MDSLLIDGFLVGWLTGLLVSKLAETLTSGNINLLKPSGLFPYRQVKLSKILRGSRFALSVLYGCQNRQRLLLYTSLTDWL